MSKKRTSLYLREEQIEAAKEIARNAHPEDGDELSQSEVLRKAIDVGLRESELSDYVDEHTRILLNRERFIDREVKVQKLRMGFPGRVRYHLKNQFEAGLRVEDLPAFAANLKRDATILWPDDPDRVEREHEYVDRWIDTARAAIEASDFSPLDPAQVFGAYASIAEAVEDTEAREQLPAIVAELRERLETNPGGGPRNPDPMRDPDAVIDVISKDRDVDPDAVREAIEEITDKPIRRLTTEDIPDVPELEEIGGENRETSTLTTHA